MRKVTLQQHWDARLAGQVLQFAKVDPDSEGASQLEALQKAGFDLRLSSRPAEGAFVVCDPEDEQGYRLAGSNVPALIRQACKDLLKETT